MLYFWWQFILLDELYPLAALNLYQNRQADLSDSHKKATCQPTTITDRLARDQSSTLNMSRRYDNPLLKYPRQLAVCLIYQCGYSSGPFQTLLPFTLFLKSFTAVTTTRHSLSSPKNGICNQLARDITLRRTNPAPGRSACQPGGHVFLGRTLLLKKKKRTNRREETSSSRISSTLRARVTQTHLGTPHFQS